MITQEMMWTGSIGRGLKKWEDCRVKWGHYLTETEEEFLKDIKKENYFKDEEDSAERRKPSQLEGTVPWKGDSSRILERNKGGKGWGGNMPMVQERNAKERNRRNNSSSSKSSPQEPNGWDSILTKSLKLHQLPYLCACSLNHWTCSLGMHSFCEKGF